MSTFARDAATMNRPTRNELATVWPPVLVRDGVGGVPSHFRRIVAPLDGSPLSERILEHARYLPHSDPPAELFLIDVVQPLPRD